MWDPHRIGKRGGHSQTPAKVRAARLNGAKGGRPVKLPPMPKGARDSSPRDFPEYYALMAVRLRTSAEPHFSEREVLDTLRRMRRYDLVYRRRKQHIPPPNAAMRRLKRALKEAGERGG